MVSTKILNALKDFGRDKVFHLGVCLDVPTKKLEEIEVDHQTSNRRLSKVIDYWVDNDPECTWKKLSEALCEVGEQNLGRKIRDEHVLKQPKDPRVSCNIILSACESCSILDSVTVAACNHEWYI